jgi:hypothetical protein
MTVGPKYLQIEGERGRRIVPNELILAPFSLVTTFVTLSK